MQAHTFNKITDDVVAATAVNIVAVTTATMAGSSSGPSFGSIGSLDAKCAAAASGVVAATARIFGCEGRDGKATSRDDHPSENGDDIFLA